MQAKILGGGGSSGGVLIVNYTVESSNDGYIVTEADHTFAELETAIADGLSLVAHVPDEYGTVYILQNSSYILGNEIEYSITAFSPATDRYVNAFSIVLTHGVENGEEYMRYEMADARLAIAT